MPRLPRRPRLIVMVVVLLVLLLVVLSAFVRLYTDLLWFRSVHFSSVFGRRLTTEIVLFVVFGLLMSVIVGVNIFLAHRLRPPYRAMSQEQQQLDALTHAIAPVRRWIFVVVVGLVGLFSCVGAANRWSIWLQWSKR